MKAKKHARFLSQVLTGSQLQMLFEEQIRTLRNRGCPKLVTDALKKCRADIIQAVSRLDIGRGNIPFLPVISRSVLDILDQVPSLSAGMKRGYTPLRPGFIFDPSHIGLPWYYIFDVEDGTATLGLSPVGAQELLEEGNRVGLTEVEIIALCLHSETLSKHDVYAVGVRVGPNEVPVLEIHAGRPWLDSSGSDSNYHNKGTPSCAVRSFDLTNWR